MEWNEGQRVRGKNQYAGETGTVVCYDGWISKPSTSRANARGKKVHVQWDNEIGSTPDIVEDKNLELL